MRQETINHRYVIAAGIALVAAVYFPLIAGLDYVWDDMELFVHRPVLRSVEYLPQSLFEPILPGTTYLRPLVLATFAVEFLATGVSPLVSHVVNLLIHAANTALVGIILRSLHSRRGVALSHSRLLTALLIYGFHPVMIEPVAWSAGRFDLLFAFFGLLTVLSYLSRSNWCVGFAFLGAALSKEAAVVLPLILLGLAVIESGFSWHNLRGFLFRQRGWTPFVVMLVLGVAYLLLRFVIFGRVAHQDVAVTGSLPDVFSRLGFVGQTVLFYLRMAFWPFADLNPQHPVDLNSVSFGWFLWGWVTCLTTAWATYLTIKHRYVPGVYLAMMLISLLPVLNLVPVTIGGNIGHERFFAFPLLFLSLAIGSLKTPQVTMSIAMRRSLGPASVTLLVSWLIMAVLNINLTVPLWRNDLSLWSWAHEKNPDSDYISLSYLSVLSSYKWFSKGDEFVALIDEKDPDTKRQMIIGKGLYLIKRGQYDDALLTLTAVEPKVFKVHELADAALGSIQNYRVDPRSMSVWEQRSLYVALAEASNAVRDFRMAEKYSDIAVFYAPYLPLARLQQAWAAYGKGDVETGNRAFETASQYVIPSALKEIESMRTSFISQLCRNDFHPENNPTCNYFSKGAGDT